jgi:uncharacterized membrane protein YkgB
MISFLNEAIDWLVKLLTKAGLLKKVLDYNLLRASMVIIFLLFGYQKCFLYDAKVLIPYIGNDPFLSRMYPAFGIQGGSWLLALSIYLLKRDVMRVCFQSGARSQVGEPVRHSLA